MALTILIGVKEEEGDFAAIVPFVLFNFKMGTTNTMMLFLSLMFVMSTGAL